MTDELRPLLATFETHEHALTEALAEEGETGQPIRPEMYYARDDAAVEVARAMAARDREATLSPAVWLDMAERDPSRVNLHEVRYALDALRISGFTGMAGGFILALCEAVIRADTGNRQRLARGFPSLVQAFNVYNYVPGGTARLVALAEYR